MVFFDIIVLELFMENTVYDIIIIGGGPAGLTASIYARRSNAKTLVIEEYWCGGQILNTYEIKNYPAFENIAGTDLASKIEKQARDLGAEIVYQKVQSVDLTQKIKQISTNKQTFFAKAVILAIGAKPRKLGIENEQKFSGRGVSYCAVCDGEFFKGKTVAIVGGGNSALEDVAYLSNIAKKTYLINRSQKYRAIPPLVEQMQKLVKHKKIELIENSVVEKIEGDDKVGGIGVKNIVTGKTKQLEVDGLFVEIGRQPDTKFLQGQVQLDSFGFVIADQSMQTSQAGVFACGDVTQRSLKQIVIACSDGAIASSSAVGFLQNLQAQDLK